MPSMGTDFELYDVIDFELIGGYAVRIQFDDNTEQVIDFEPVLSGPLFGQLHDPNMFGQVKLDKDIGTLIWPNGADIDPTVLHDWPLHVDAIIQRRKEQFTIAA